MASEFFVRSACKFRGLTGGKSRKLQDAAGGKGTAKRAAVLCGIPLNKRGHFALESVAQNGRSMPIIMKELKRLRLGG